MDSKTLSTACSVNKYINHVISGLLLIAPAWSVVSGLALAPLLGIVVLMGLAIYLPNVKNWAFIPFQPLHIKIALIFLCWALVSAAWAINFGSALELWGKMACLIIGGAITVSVFTPRLYVTVYAMILALSVLFIERFSDGVLTTWIHQIFSRNTDFHYNIDELNRGATVITLFIWPALWRFIRDGYRVAALFLWAATFILLLSLGSLSAVTGLAAGSLCFICVLLAKDKALKGLIVLALVGITLTPLIMLYQKPQEIMAHFPEIPASCEHRLYIWQFASKKALQHPVHGWGLNASRHIPILPSEMLSEEKSPLPIHPHNNVTQLWLELGITGLLLFATFITALFVTIRHISTDNVYKAACASSLAAYLVIGYTAYGIWQEWWMAAGFLLALSFITEETSRKTS